MKYADIPTKVPVPFANSGSKNTIPTNSQIGVTPGAASLTDGFPPLTFTPVSAGGIPPFGKDFNGILYRLSENTRWNNAGGFYKYDSAFSSSVNGYPKGAVLLRSDEAGLWISTADDNTNNPDTGGANWVGLSFGAGSETISTTTTLTVSDAGLIEVDASAGPLTITLPAASSLAGINFQFSRIDSTRNIVTISAASGDSIEGSSTIGLYRSDRIALSSDGGTVWRYYTRRISQGTLPTGQDLNALTTAGLYETSQDISSTSVVSITNGPVSYIPSGQLLVMQSGLDTMTQILADQNGGHLWFRSASFYNNTFSSWYDLKSEEKIGVNQSWQNVSSNRTTGATYTNSTGRPIMVNVEYNQAGTNQASGNLYIGGALVARGGQAGAAGGQTLSGIVPAGSTYHLTTGTNGFYFWMELR